jgi:hypothetical protein
MVSGPDILLVAKAMLWLYGDKALKIIERRTADNVANWNVETAKFWFRVTQAAREMQSNHPPPHELGRED